MQLFPASFAICLGRLLFYNIRLERAITLRTYPKNIVVATFLTQAVRTGQSLF